MKYYPLQKSRNISTSDSTENIRFVYFRRYRNVISEIPLPHIVQLCAISNIHLFGSSLFSSEVLFRRIADRYAKLNIRHDERD